MIFLSCRPIMMADLRTTNIYKYEFVFNRKYTGNDEKPRAMIVRMTRHSSAIYLFLDSGSLPTSTQDRYIIT